MKKYVYIILMILFCSLVDAQEEISYQTVEVGGYIKQYAVIEEIAPSGGVVKRLCTDSCSCTLSLRDTSANSFQIESKNMTLIDPGLFGYLVKSGELIEGRQYIAYANCSSSALNIWGIAYSEVRLSERIALGAQQEELQDIQGSQECSGAFGGITCALNDILKTLNVATAFLDPVTWVVNAISQFSLEFGKAIGQIEGVGTLVKTGYHAFYGIIKALVLSGIKLISDPGRWWAEDWIPFWWNVLAGLIMLVFVPFMFLEMFILGSALMRIQNLRNNPRARFFTFITAFFMMHISILKISYSFAHSVLEAISWIIDMISKALGFIKSLVLPVSAGI